MLCLARNYPNNVLPRLGLWTERLVRACAPAVQTTVISPVPYWPPIPGPDSYTRFRRVHAREERNGVDVRHPRFLTGPGYLLHAVEAVPYHASVKRETARVRTTFPFDLIHAHSIYPDGWTGARLARQYGLPLVITEHSSWTPWLDRYPSVRRRALWAAAQSACLVAVSRPLADAIATYTGQPEKIRVIPNVVDGGVFSLRPDAPRAASADLLFVGLMRHVKGVDVLLRAVRLLRDRGRAVTLTLIGDSFYATYQRDYEQLRALATELTLDDVVTFAGGKSPVDVARAMQSAAMLVLPSRRETFAAVLAEALACGTPVVATRCGGPEDIVDERVGVLVPPEDPVALAAGIGTVLDRRDRYDPRALRTYALDRFGVETVGRQLVELYRDVAGGSR